MTLNRVKLGRATTFMKYLSSVVFLNEITFPASNSLNFAELVENELTKSISKKLPISLFLPNLSLLIVKDFKRL